MKVVSSSPQDPYRSVLVILFSALFYVHVRFDPVNSSVCCPGTGYPHYPGICASIIGYPATCTGNRSKKVRVPVCNGYRVPVCNGYRVPDGVQFLDCKQSHHVSFCTTDI